MAIVSMKKLILAAPSNYKEDILNLLQSMGYVEIIDLRGKADEIEGVEPYKVSESISDAEIELSHIKFTYEFLSLYDSNKEGLFAKKEILSKDEFDSLEHKIAWRDVYRECKSIEENITSLKNRISKAASSMEQYRLWQALDVSFKELDGLRRVSYFIGTISKKYEFQLYDELTSSIRDIYIEKISQKQEDLNIFILCHRNDEIAALEILKKHGFVKLTLDLTSSPSNRVMELNNEIEALKKELEELNGKARQMTERIKDIEKIYDYMTNKIQKEKMSSKLINTKKTFILNGWLPQDKEDEFKSMLNKQYKDVYIDFEDPVDEDIVPVKLKNNPIVEPFEVITSMYALPLSDEIDPTPVLTPFFLIFFGMMMADIGYGVLMAVVSAFMLYRVELEGDLKKIVKLGLYCSIPTIIFGFLYGSFFGGIIKLTPLWLDPVNRPMEVLAYSVAFGIVHLYVGLGVKAYNFIRDGKMLDAFFDVGSWYLLLTGLIWLLVSSIAGVGGAEIAKWLSIVGALLILFTQGRSSETLVGKFFGGLYSLYGVTSYLGDALSYSRLLALGLASGLIGWSFNLLVGLLGSGVVAAIFGPIIFLAGHTFNFAIGLLGTFVHTARLQYLEFFGKFYEGGGRAFEPLKINTKFIKVSKVREQN